MLRTSREPPPSVAALSDVQSRISRASRDAGRSAADVELVCVSKNFDAEHVRPLLDAGQRVFGENRVQEAKDKWGGLRRDYAGIELHLIGRLQSNKADDAVAVFDVIETIDRPKIAEAVARAMRASGKTPRLLIQVNTGDEEQKAGVAAAGLPALLEACKQLGLAIDGLMCIPPVDQLASPHFALLAKLRAEHGLRTLSMGMSADFELAIQLGANFVRVGTAIFGARGT